jgi:hypothetical protein
MIYKCEINWKDAKTPTVGRIEEIHEKTLEVLGNKIEIDALKGIDEIHDDDHIHEEQSKNAKKKPKQSVQREKFSLHADDPLKFTEKQLNLLPNKALNSVAIKQKNANQKLEMTDDDQDVEFQEEVFKYMDDPRSNQQINTSENEIFEFKEVSQWYQPRPNKELSTIQTNSVNTKNLRKPTFSDSFDGNSCPTQSNNFNEVVGLTQRKNEAMRMEQQKIQSTKMLACENENPFACFAFKPAQSNFLNRRDQPTPEKSPLPMVHFAKSCEQSAHQSPKILSFDAGHPISNSLSIDAFARSQAARAEGIPRETFDSDKQGNSMSMQKSHEKKMHVPQNAGLIQVQILCKFLMKKTHTVVQLLSMYKTVRESKTVCNFVPTSTVEIEGTSAKSSTSSRAALIV